MRAKRVALLGGILAVLAIVTGPALAEVIHLEIEDYLAGGEGVGFHDNDASNNGGQYRTAVGDGVDIEKASDIGGGFNVGWTNAGEWMYLTVDPGTWTTNPTFAGGQAYYVYARVSPNADGTACSVDIGDGAAGASLALPNMHGWQNWTTVSGLTDAAVAAGQQTVKFICDTSGFNVNWIELSTAPLSDAVAIPQRLDPRTGHYYERYGNFTWDEARANDATNPPTFQGAIGEWVIIHDNAEAMTVAGLGDAWLPLTDSTAVSTIDSWDATTLGTAEGGDESALPYPADTNGDGVVNDSVPVSGERGYGWVWIDGSPVVYQKWANGEPNDWSGAEDACQLRSDGFWNDHQTGSTLEGQGDHRLPYLVRYETVLDQYTWQVTERVASPTFSGNGLIESMAEAIDLLNSSDPDDWVDEVVAAAYGVSFQDPEAGGGQAGWVRAPFYTDTLADDNDFVFRASGQVEIPGAGGIYTFAVVHDDFARLTADGNVFDTPGATGTDLFVVDFASGGAKDLELLFYERGGGAYIQLFAAMGDWTEFVPARFFLVGDELGGGLAMAPEPATLALLGSGAAMALLVRRRRQ